MRKLIGLVFTLALILESAGLVVSASSKTQKGNWSGNKYVQIREVTPKKAAKPTAKSTKKPTEPSNKASTSVKTSSSKRSNSPAYRIGSGTRKSYNKPYRTRRYYRTDKTITYKKPQPQTVQKPPTSQVPEQSGITGVVTSFDVGGRTIVVSSNNQRIVINVPRDVDVRMPGHGLIDISEIPGNARVKVKGIPTGANTVEARFVEVYGN